MRISFAAPAESKSGAVAGLVTEGGTLAPSLADLDGRLGGALARAIKSSRFTGKKGEILEVLAPAGLSASRVVLLGLGKPAEAGPLDFERIGGDLLVRLNAAGEKEAAVTVDALPDFRLEPSEVAARVAFGAQLRSYRFDKYRTTEKPERKPSLKKLTVMAAAAAGAKKAYAKLEKIGEGVFATRDLCSEPANVLYPESFAKQAKKALEKVGVEVEILGEKEMDKLGMGSLLGVGQGSVRESQLLILRWMGSGKAVKGKSKSASRSKGKAVAGLPLAIVGKGVCFDTGGISIKPAAGMEDMKWDMGGAGVVVGLFHALAARKAKIDVIGACALVENMPDGNAQRPGDVVHSMSGQTIEVINTDAEGRLILADALWYVQETYKPKAIVDLATLTGAIMVALGRTHAGLFSNDDELSERILAAGKTVGEPCWRMPMGEDFDRMIDSDIADMKNVGGRWGGSITAAQFLERFIQDGTAWAHLDIAGVTWSDKDRPTGPKGATGFGVRLLDELVAKHYEK
ncbi:leucyl aminopeptidase [Algihabitans albus]|uniref:leucyl aminopeptidase n=1 Tax=Algihabitans albus TaxID=2164067 RepID=UPI000E5CF60B|nr:leucyl aminopeptidase [Algihabitans albus]